MNDTDTSNNIIKSRSSTVNQVTIDLTKKCDAYVEHNTNDNNSVDRQFDEHRADKKTSSPYKSTSPSEKHSLLTTLDRLDSIPSPKLPILQSPSGVSTIDLSHDSSSPIKALTPDRPLYRSLNKTQSKLESAKRNASFSLIETHQQLYSPINFGNDDTRRKLAVKDLRKSKKLEKRKEIEEKMKEEQVKLRLKELCEKQRRIIASVKIREQGNELKAVQKSPKEDHSRLLLDRKKEVKQTEQSKRITVTKEIGESKKKFGQNERKASQKKSTCDAEQATGQIVVRTVSVSLASDRGASRTKNCILPTPVVDVSLNEDIQINKTCDANLSINPLEHSSHVVESQGENSTLTILPQESIEQQDDESYDTITEDSMILSDDD